MVKVACWCFVFITLGLVLLKPSSDNFVQTDIFPQSRISCINCHNDNLSDISDNILEIRCQPLNYKLKCWITSSNLEPWLEDRYKVVPVSFRCTDKQFPKIPQDCSLIYNLVDGI